jgi:hypothetical protein
VLQVWGNVKCDSGYTVAGATHLVARASGATIDGSIRFLGEFFITANAFALDQVLNFGSLAYIPNCYGELCPLNGVALTSNELPTSPPSLGLLGVNLEILAP